MTWIKENTFWAGSIAVASIVALLFVYAYLTSPLSSLASDVEEKTDTLRTQVQKTEQGANVIPPRKRKKIIRQRDEQYGEQLRELARYYLRATKDLERWFNDNPNPTTGSFQGYYMEAKTRLRRLIRQSDVRLRQGNENVFGGGGDQARAIDWPEKPTEDMSRTQKEFWIIRRLVQDSIQTGVEGVTKIRFRRSDNQKGGVTIPKLGGQRLARRIRVTCSFVVPPRNIGRLLSRLMETSPEGDEAIRMHMYLSGYSIRKRETTTASLPTDRTTWARLQNVQKNEWKNWSSGGLEEMPDPFRAPPPVGIELDLVILDVHEPTVVEMMKRAGMKTGAIREEIRSTFPFYTEQQIQNLVGG